MSIIEVNKEISKAKVVASLAHAGQTRRDKVTPYVTHPLAVADMVRPYIQSIAILHDVLESDTVNQLDAQDLIDLGFSNYVIEGVVALTNNGRDYDTYIQNQVLLNKHAIEVKAADMKHNLSSDPSENSKKKIAKWLPILETALNNP